MRPNNVGGAHCAAVAGRGFFIARTIFDCRLRIKIFSCNSIFSEPRPAPRLDERTTVAFRRIFAAIMAVVAAHNVARNAVPTIAVGRVDPAAARMAIAVVGINCTEPY